MTKTELEINGFYSTESSTMFVTATITSCNESDCSESVVTYVSNDSYTTVTTDTPMITLLLITIMFLVL